MTSEEEHKEVVEESDEEIEIPIKKEPEKPVKAKRVMSPEALEKLAIARKKAFEVKTANAKIRAENKKVLVKQITEEQEEATKQKIKKSIKPKPIPVKEVKEAVEEEEEDDEPQVVKKKAVKKKKKPVVIIEESSSSDDESNVVYIKRRSKKPPKEQPVAPPPPNPEPPPVVRQEFSAFDRQMLLQRAALRMF